MSEHTPRPWYFDEFGTRGSDGPSCFRIRGADGVIADTFGYSARDEANARLMTAAPDLLEALKACGGLQARTGTLRFELCWCHSDIDTEEFGHEPQCETARAAIRKAEGGAS